MYKKGRKELISSWIVGLSQKQLFGNLEWKNLLALQNPKSQYLGAVGTAEQLWLLCVYTLKILCIRAVFGIKIGA